MSNTSATEAVVYTQPNPSTTTATSNKPIIIPKARNSKNVIKTALDVLAGNPIKSTTIGTSNPPIKIPKSSDKPTQEQVNNVVSHECRHALNEYFEEHDYNYLHNPIAQRLSALVSGKDLDNDSKKALAKLFIDEPPPELNINITARTLDKYLKPLTNDPDELIKHRFLCRGGGMLLVGQTGHGKSSLSMQLAIKWSLGQSCFGLEPARPIKSLVVQAENDDGDIAEIKEGVFSGLNLSTEDQETASKNVLVIQVNEKTGVELIEQIIKPLLTNHKPDLLWIDPALSFIKGDMNSQEAVGRFLRNLLNPVLAQHKCGAIVIHHTNKPIASPDKITIDPAYLGAGSAEWANWARAIIALRKTDVVNLYELVAGKRGTRLKWKAADGETACFSKYISHCKRPDTIFWLEMALSEAEELKANNGKTAEDVLKHVPQAGLIAKDDLIGLCRKSSIGKNMIPELLKELIDGGELFEHYAKRQHARPKVLLSRLPNERKEIIMLDLYTRDSNGIYYPPK